jgi:hypothetical protein
MVKFFQPNIDRRGRIARAIYGAACIIAGLFCLRLAWWAAAALFAAGLLGFFEALRGWCLMRACGIKTKF